MKDFLDAFVAFNVNGINSLIYLFASNWGMFVILMSAVATAIMQARDEIDQTVRDEQNVL